MDVSSTRYKYNAALKRILSIFTSLISTSLWSALTRALNEFLAVLILATLGMLMGIGMLIVPLIFAPRKPNPVKSETFESGQLPTGEARVRLVMRYYPYLLMFLVFDVMSLFLYAWGLSYRQYALATTIPVLIFIAVIVVALTRGLSLAGRREIW
jgi:NADH-quinone oxidoreductase subunit A